MSVAACVSWGVIGACGATDATEALAEAGLVTVIRATVCAAASMEATQRTSVNADFIECMSILRLVQLCVGYIRPGRVGRGRDEHALSCCLVPLALL